MTTGNYKIKTDPKSEWQYVVDGVACPDMGHKRRNVIHRTRRRYFGAFAERRFCICPAVLFSDLGREMGAFKWWMADWSRSFP